MITTLSSKGQVVLPKAARARLRLDSGTKFDCKIEGGAIVLTPLTAKPAASKLVKDKNTGLIVTKGSTTQAPVTSALVRELRDSFP